MKTLEEMLRASFEKKYSDFWVPKDQLEYMEKVLKKMSVEDFERWEVVIPYHMKPLKYVADCLKGEHGDDLGESASAWLTEKVESFKKLSDEAFKKG